MDLIDPNIPLIDLHHHLEGSIRLATILDLGQQYNIPLPAWNIEGLRPHVQVMEPQPGVMAFIEKFNWMTEILVNYDACYRVAYENVEDAHQEGIDYIELRFSPLFMAEKHKLNPAGVVEAVSAGAEQAEKDYDIKVSLIGIISRTYGGEKAWKELNAILDSKNHIKAVDLAGDEANFSGELFLDHFRLARERGYQITIHAGEAAGPDSIWQAINELGATRIGHAIHALEDDTLMDVLAERNIGIETNLTSNVQTSSVTNYISHPLRIFLEHGLLATINTDDPGISGIDLHHEYNIAAPAAGLSPDQIRQAQNNALYISFLSPKEKNGLLEKKLSTFKKISY